MFRKIEILLLSIGFVSISATAGPAGFQKFISPIVSGFAGISSIVIDENILSCRKVGSRFTWIYEDRSDWSSSLYYDGSNWEPIITSHQKDAINNYLNNLSKTDVDVSRLYAQNKKQLTEAESKRVGQAKANVYLREQGKVVSRSLAPDYNTTPRPEKDIDAEALKTAITDARSNIKAEVILEQLKKVGNSSSFSNPNEQIPQTLSDSTGKALATLTVGKMSNNFPADQCPPITLAKDEVQGKIEFVSTRDASGDRKMRVSYYNTKDAEVFTFFEKKVRRGRLGGKAKNLDGGAQDIDLSIPSTVDEYNSTNH